MTSRSSSFVPGDLLLHPMNLAAVTLLVVNDHFLKHAYGNWWTGKLSDFAGMIVFPLLLHACSEWTRELMGRRRERRIVDLVPGLALTLALFASINTIPYCASLYRDAVTLVWRTAGLLSSDALAAHTLDPTDLIALPFLLVPVWMVTRDTAREEHAPDGHALFE
jgi:hypothetical protein